MTSNQERLTYIPTGALVVAGKTIDDIRRHLVAQHTEIGALRLEVSDLRTSLIVFGATTPGTPPIPRDDTLTRILEDLDKIRVPKDGV